MRSGFMRSSLVTPVLFCAALMLPGSLLAQDVQPDPINEVTRYKVYFYKFTPEGKDLARRVLWNHMLPAMREAGVVEPIILHPEDGEWDMVSLYPLPGGYDDLHFNISPSDARWQSIAARGSKGEEFKALGAQMQKAIVRETSFIAHRHDKPDP